MAKQGIKIGNKAPKLGAIDEDGARCEVADLAGQWVAVYFYPKDDTPGCTTEACEFSSDLADFEKLGATVVGISPDTPESHRKFRSKHGLTMKLLSDPDHQVLERYGAWGEKSMYGRTYQGVIRSTVLIDPEGRVAYQWSKVKPAGHAEEVRTKLAELQTK
jgi:thioredoxin-dependent peroxiredoxin